MSPASKKALLIASGALIAAGVGTIGRYKEPKYAGSHSLGEPKAFIR